MKGNPAESGARRPNHVLAVPQQTADGRQPSLEVVERNYILTVLQQTNWVITGPSGAAKLLDLPPVLSATG
jgi:hypothetical protein